MSKVFYIGLCLVRFDRQFYLWVRGLLGRSGHLAGFRRRCGLLFWCVYRFARRYELRGEMGIRFSLSSRFSCQNTCTVYFCGCLGAYPAFYSAYHFFRQSLCACCRLGLAFVGSWDASCDNRPR